MTNRSGTFENSSGFTLIEVMLATMLLTTVLGGAYLMWHFVQQNILAAQGTSQSIYDVNRVLSQIVAHVREARDGESGAYLLTEATDTSLTFYSDIDGDMRTERVRYFLDGPEIKRGVVEATGVPPEYILASEQVVVLLEAIEMEGLPVFRYYNEAWPADVVNNPLIQSERLLHTRFMDITLQIQSDLTQELVSLTHSVHLRNTKQNY